MQLAVISLVCAATCGYLACLRSGNVNSLGHWCGSFPAVLALALMALSASSSARDTPPDQTARWRRQVEKVHLMGVEKTHARFEQILVNNN